MRRRAAVPLAREAPCASDAAAPACIIGYSPDSRYFAFEQYGTQDGSGFPYADIFILDLKTNAWVDGSPIRILIEDETATLAAARAKAIATAASRCCRRIAITEPASVLAAKPATEVQADRSAAHLRPLVPAHGRLDAATRGGHVRHALHAEGHGQRRVTGARTLQGLWRDR